MVLYATATNSDRSGDQQTDVQLLFAALMREVQLMPSGLVITRLPAPLIDTATNSERLGDQQIDRHTFALGVDLRVHVMPSGEVMAP